MNIDKNNISAPKQLIGGERRDKGVLQIFFQSTDAVAYQGARYPTGLNGVYDLKLLDLKVISAAAAGTEFCVEMLSDTFRLDRGNTNDNFKFMHRNGAPEVPNPVKFRQAEVRNWVNIDFQQFGLVGGNIDSAAYNILLTIEYEKL
jgi:hypothetical protein